MHRAPGHAALIFGLFTTLLAPGIAVAHDVATLGAASVTAGILHPLTGLDHLLAMLAVGLWASQLGGRAAWLLPALFPALMIVGTALAFHGLALPLVEPAIALSVIVLGALIAGGVYLPLALGAPLIAAFALAHGHAHGTEAPTGGNLAGYAVGFIATTIILHLSGLFAGLALKPAQRGTQTLARAGGTALVAIGVMLLTR